MESAQQPDKHDERIPFRKSVARQWGRTLGRHKPEDLLSSSPIISRAESLRILKNDLRKGALESRASKLQGASAEVRQRILAEIESRIEEEVRRRLRQTPHHGHVLY
jgi:hypothetical protein